MVGESGAWGSIERKISYFLRIYHIAYKKKICANICESQIQTMSLRDTRRAAVFIGFKTTQALILKLMTACRRDAVLVKNI